MLRLADLREILRYVPQYRDHLFVIALDGAAVEHVNFRNLILDISLLRSLRIGVVLTHGAGHQIRQLSRRSGITVSNFDGTGVTDEQTLQLAITAATDVSHQILALLSANDLRGAYCNAMVAHPAGILQGTDYQFSGRVERVDTKQLTALLQSEIIPVLPPLGCDGEGQTYRLNSDTVAAHVAAALKAVKLVYLTTEPGLSLLGETETDSPELIRHMTVEEAEQLFVKQRHRLQPMGISKLQQSLSAARKGVPRIHIIDAGVEEGLLAEVFSHEGIGTLIHTNEYQAIRPAQRKDAANIYSLIVSSMETDELMHRSQEQIEEQIDDFIIFEIDHAPAGCVALHKYPESDKAEMACLCVNGRYENQRIGIRLMTYLETQARELGFRELFCLSTQAYNYFVQKGGYHKGSPDDLPPERRTKYDKSGRKSQVLVKPLT